MCVLVGTQETERALQMWCKYLHRGRGPGIAFQHWGCRWSVFPLTVSLASGATRLHYVPLHHWVSLFTSPQPTGSGMTKHSFPSAGEWCGWRVLCMRCPHRSSVHSAHHGLPIHPICPLWLCRTGCICLPDTFPEAGAGCGGMLIFLCEGKPAAGRFRFPSPQ